MRGPDVKTVIVIGVASISGFVEIVESLGTLFLSGLIEINKKEVEEVEVVEEVKEEEVVEEEEEEDVVEEVKEEEVVEEEEEEDVVEEVKNITKSKLVTFKCYF